MAAILEETSTISAKGQTTIPKSVRQALGLGLGGKIAFRVDAKGVTVHRAEESDDPAMDAFLAFLARDLEQRPEAVEAISPALAARLNALIAGIDVELDEAITGDVAL